MSALRKEPTLTRQSGPWDDEPQAVVLTPAPIQPRHVATTQVVEQDEDDEWAEWNAKSTLRKTFDISLCVLALLSCGILGPGTTFWLLLCFVIFVYLPFAVLRFFWRLLHWKQQKPKASTTVIQNHYHYQ